MPEHHKRRATTPGAAGASPPYRNRVAIDTDGTRTALDNADNVRRFWYSTLGKFYGVESIVFDEIRVAITADLGTAFTLDSLQYNISPVPAALALSLSARAGVGLLGWRRRTA